MINTIIPKLIINCKQKSVFRIPKKSELKFTISWYTERYKYWVNEVAFGNETVTFTENYEGNKITIYNGEEGGLYFVNESITFNKDVYFPNGSSTTVGSYEKYVDSNNPGFTIKDPASFADGGLGVKFASVGETTNEKFYIGM